MDKEQFMDNVTNEIIRYLDFEPARDKFGNVILGSSLKILQRSVPGSFNIIQVIDADIAGEYNIKLRINRIEDMIARTSYRGRIHALFILVYYSSAAAGFYNEYALFSNNITVLKVDLDNSMVIGNTRESLVNSVAKILENNLLSGSGDVQLNIDDILSASYPPQSYRRPKVYTPYITYTFIIINTVIWFIGIISEIITGINIVNVLGIKSGLNIIRGEYWRLITPMFLHADIMHLGANSFSLYIFGEAVESIVGHWKFAAIYLVSGILGNIASFAMTPSLSLGASGAVLGVGGALVYMWIKNKGRITGSRGQYMTLVFMVFLNIIYGFNQSGIDNFAHIGGALGGYLMAGLLGQKGQRVSGKDRIFSAAGIIIIALICLTVGFINYSRY